MKRTITLWTSAAALLVSGSCSGTKPGGSSLDDTDGDTSHDTSDDTNHDTMDCGISSKKPACVACVEELCCGEGRACASNPDCVEIFKCAATCGGESACQNACSSEHPDGAAEFDEFAECFFGSCQKDCLETDCGFAAEPTCLTCLEAACCDEARACAKSSECEALNTCAAKCEGGAECIAGCKDEHNDGILLMDALYACLEKQCETACFGSADTDQPDTDAITALQCAECVKGCQGQPSCCPDPGCLCADPCAADCPNGTQPCCSPSLKCTCWKIGECPY